MHFVVTARTEREPAHDRRKDENVVDGQTNRQYARRSALQHAFLSFIDRITSVQVDSKTTSVSVETKVVIDNQNRIHFHGTEGLN